MLKKKINGEIKKKKQRKISPTFFTDFGFALGFSTTGVFDSSLILLNRASASSSNVSGTFATCTDNKGLINVNTEYIVISNPSHGEQVEGERVYGVNCKLSLKKKWGCTTFSSPSNGRI